MQRTLPRCVYGTAECTEVLVRAGPSAVAHPPAPPPPPESDSGVFVCLLCVTGLFVCLFVCSSACRSSPTCVASAATCRTTSSSTCSTHSAAQRIASAAQRLRRADSRGRCVTAARHWRVDRWAHHIAPPLGTAAWHRRAQRWAAAGTSALSRICPSFRTRRGAPPRPLVRIRISWQRLWLCCAALARGGRGQCQPPLAGGGAAGGSAPWCAVLWWLESVGRTPLRLAGHGMAVSVQRR